MKFVFLLSGLLFAMGINAQAIKVYGKVIDSETGPIPGATVMLIGQEDSILKSFAVTDKEGNFVIQGVKSNDYLFKANFYGYQPSELQFSVYENSVDTVLGEFVLMPKLLDVVTVNADYIPIQIKGDTLEYDSRAFETGEHDVVENLLEQLPGVEVMEDGRIKVQGKIVEKILVDGEEFFGNDPTIATKNLPAEAVEKVQVFDKDSDMASFTGVDDGDETTTINLKLKDDHKKGYFGNLEAGYGMDENGLDDLENDPRYKLKGNMHYFKGKWQASVIGLSNNVNETGFSINDYISFMGGIQNLMDGSGSINLGGDQGLPIDFGQNIGFLNTNAVGFNLNYKPSKKATVSSSAFFNSFDKTFDRSINRTTFFQDSSLFSQEKMFQNNLSFNNRANIHYKQEFDSTHFLNVDLAGQWTKANFNNNNDLTNFDQDLLIRNAFLTDLSQQRIQYNGTLELDYRKKFRKRGAYFGAGAFFGLENKTASSRLAYKNTLYLPNPIAVQIIQNQSLLETNSNWGGNSMYSMPISKKQLVQAELLFKRKDYLRNKAVRDEQETGSVLNSLLSGDAAYGIMRTQGELRHKYLSKRLKTTVGVTYEHLQLISSDVFTKVKAFDYALPFFDLQWEINKSSDFRLNYRTTTNAPSLAQLQPIPDNSNPAEIVNGNVNLIPAYKHDISLEYNVFNEYNFLHFLARFGASRTLNKINYSQQIDANFNRVFTPENNGIENQLNSNVSFGMNLSPLKTKFNIEHNANVSNGQINLNGVPNNYTSLYNNARLTIENMKKKVINIRTGIEATYSQNIYRQNEALNGTFFSWSYSGNITGKIKDKWVLNVNAKHNFYPSFEINNQQVIVNTSIARNLLPSKKLQVYIAAFDLLNQNTGINQSYFLNYYEEERTATLARYFMLGVKYSFKKLGAK